MSNNDELSPGITNNGDQTESETYDVSSEGKNSGKDGDDYKPETVNQQPSGSDTETDNETNRLENLGVELVEQTQLESRLHSNASKLLAQQSLEIDQKRLQRTQAKLNKINYELRKLQNKLSSPLVKISEKEKLRSQINEVKSGKLKETEDDIKDITQRINKVLSGEDQIKDNNSKTALSNIDERHPGESEKEYLIRTGKLTAFGNTAGFIVDIGDDDKVIEEDTMGPISHQNLRVPGFINRESSTAKITKQVSTSKEQKPKRNRNVVEDGDFMVNDEADEDDYPEDEEEQDNECLDEYILEATDPTLPGRKKHRLLTEDEIRNVDDGNSNFFESRLKTWCHHRSKHRSDPASFQESENIAEWFKPHPSHADAVLTAEFKIPGDIYPSLFDYQRTGIQWLYELYSLSHGGIISDEMGLGKTIQIVSFVAGLHYSGLLKKGHPVLIVCPATVLTQWVNEFHSWWGGLRVMVLHSIGSGMQNKKFQKEEELEEGLEDELMYEDGEREDKFKKYGDLENVKQIMDTLLNCENGGVLITSYVGLRIYEDYLLDVPWGCAVLDEGHKIKNPNSNITILAKRLKTPHRIILSGTPIQNNLLELWSLFDFVYPGRLGTLPVFLNEFETPIKVGGYANATNLQVKIGYQKAVILKDLIQPFLLRRMKVDVARDLPSKSEYVLMCRLTKVQKEKYLEFLRSLEFKVTSYLGAITTLRKICNHPDLVDLRFTNKNAKSYGDPSRSGKLQVLKNLLKLWKEQQHKVLLFTQTKQMMIILEKFLTSEYGPHYKFMKMSGETPIGKRQDMIHSFNTTDYDLFLLTTKVGGLGVNLTGADRVIIFDPDWNPSTDLQARERAWRLGQKKEVVIYRMVIGGSIEEKIYHRQIFKMLLTDKILKDPNQKRGGFKNEELRDLFTLSDFQDDHEKDLLSNGAKSKKSNKGNQDDLEDLKSITGLSKMEKYRSETKIREEDSLMTGLFKGTARVSKHDDIYDSHIQPRDPFESHLEKQAKNEANKALKALKKSRKVIKKSGVGVPTFTGMFGIAGRIGKAGVGLGLKSRSGSPMNGNSSASILANLKQKSSEESQLTTPESNSSTDIANSQTLDKFIKYLQTQPDNFSKSKNILDGCGIRIKDNKDLTLMRSLLKSVCVWDQARAGWVLKEEFR